jgi:hypothetical protein
VTLDHVVSSKEPIFTVHLPKLKSAKFAKPDGMNATSDDEDADILKKRFEAIFDRRYEKTDETVIYKIEELDIDEDLKEESRSIPKAISKKEREISPGVMGLASDMLKALPEKAMEHLTLIIKKIWKGEEAHEVWHTMKCGISCF